MKALTTTVKAISITLALILAGCAGQEVAQTDRPRSTETAKPESDRKVPLESVVYFDYDKSTLRPQTRLVLDEHIAQLKRNNRSIRLEGHTDERGTREYNIALGERRAMAVANYMKVNGIASYRIETVSYGEERPAARGSRERSWQRNRRVEIK